MSGYIPHLSKEKRGNLSSTASPEINGKSQELKIKRLIQNLSNEDFFIKNFAANDLKKISRHAKHFLILALEDENTKIGAGAAWALGIIGPEAKDALHYLTKILNDTGKNIQMRRNAAEAIGSIGHATKEIIELLCNIINNNKEDSQLRSNAITASGKMGRLAKAIVPDLIKILNNSNEKAGIRCMAVRSLGKIKQTEKNTLKSIMDTLGDSNLMVSCEAVTALGEIGKKTAEAVPHLIKLLKNKPKNKFRHYAPHGAEIRRVATEAIKKIGVKGEESVAVLAEILNDKDEWEETRCNASMALKGKWVCNKTGHSCSKNKNF